jgi:hypothetical protein
VFVGIKQADEDACALIGKAVIDIPFPSEEARILSVEYIFGNTEISMTVTEELHDQSTSIFIGVHWFLFGGGINGNSH